MKPWRLVVPESGYQINGKAEPWPYGSRLSFAHLERVENTVLEWFREEPALEQVSVQYRGQEVLLVTRSLVGSIVPGDPATFLYARIQRALEVARTEAPERFAEPPAGKPGRKAQQLPQLTQWLELTFAKDIPAGTLTPALFLRALKPYLKPHLAAGVN